MRAYNQRGEAVTLIIVILGLLGATQLVPNFRPSNWFKKGPPTAELVAAQKKLDDADSRAKAAQLQLDKIVAENSAKKDTQIGYSQQMVAGAIESNSHAPESTEKAITDAFLQRADIGLSSAIKPLDPALKAEVISIVAQLRSGDQEKIKAANAMLVEKDKQLQQAATDRVKLEADARTVTAEKVSIAKERDGLKEVVAATQTQVVAYADTAHEKEKEAGSLGALVHKLVWVVGVIVAIVIFANWILPSLAQEFPGIGWLVALNKTTKSVTSAHA